MKNSNVIKFEPRAYLLKRATMYTESVELFLEEQEKAVLFLLRALKDADLMLKRKIIILLGSFAKQDAADAFLCMMKDDQENDEIRHLTAIQLSVMFPFLENSQPMIEEMIQNLTHPDAQIRAYTALTLGWEGNIQAAIPLIELLYDEDSDVQQAAVNALINLKDDRIYRLLIDRLENGPLEQKRCILYHLWLFSSRQNDVLAVYKKYLTHENADLRYDALVLMDTVARPESCIASYRKCLSDDDPRVRALAMERLDKMKAQI